MRSLLLLFCPCLFQVDICKKITNNTTNTCKRKHMHRYSSRLYLLIYIFSSVLVYFRHPLRIDLRLLPCSVQLLRKENSLVVAQTDYIDFGWMENEHGEGVWWRGLVWRWWMEQLVIQLDVISGSRLARRRKLKLILRRCRQSLPNICAHQRHGGIGLTVIDHCHIARDSKLQPRLLHRQAQPTGIEKHGLKKGNFRSGNWPFEAHCRRCTRRIIK